MTMQYKSSKKNEKNGEGELKRYIKFRVNTISKVRGEC
jgi:hypothetical protein